jgi:hypothetical protein
MDHPEAQLPGAWWQSTSILDYGVGIIEHRSIGLLMWRLSRRFRRMSSKSQAVLDLSGREGAAI